MRAGYRRPLVRRKVQHGGFQRRPHMLHMLEEEIQDGVPPPNGGEFPAQRRHQAEGGLSGEGGRIRGLHR